MYGNSFKGKQAVIYKKSIGCVKHRDYVNGVN
jgi:hypothetical protein